MLARESSFFNAIGSNGFKESDAHEVTLEDDKLKVARMIMWMYKKGYIVYPDEELLDWPEVSLQKLLQAAVQYDDDLGLTMEPLTCPALLDRDWKWEMSEHAAMYVMDDKYDIGGLKSYSLDQMIKCCGIPRARSRYG